MFGSAGLRLAVPNDDYLTTVTFVPTFTRP
jgi:hypothetical protein